LIDLYDQPGGYEHRRAGFVFKQLRADTAVRPYAEDLEIEVFRVIGIPALV
jgi:hypothetical protein